MGATTALARSLAVPEQLEHRDIVVEARSTTPGGVALSYGARVQPQLERMRSRKQIDARQYEAGIRLYKSWALGIAGARDTDAGGCTAWSPAGYADAQLSSALDYRNAREFCGPRLWPLLFGVVVEDMSAERWRNERGHGMDPKGVMALLRHGLDLLGDYYQM